MTRVVCTSDFHGNYPPSGAVPECDLLIIAGDFGGAPDDLGDWLAAQPAAAIVGIAGNHDFNARSDPSAIRRLPWTYLDGETTKAEGLKIHGSPWSMPFNDWAFMAPEHELEAEWAKIPASVDVLIVHGPAAGILDTTTRGTSTGSKTLRSRLRELPKLRLLVTGHIHEEYGETHVPVLTGPGGIHWLHCVNPSWVDERYRPGNPPIVVDL